MSALALLLVAVLFCPALSNEGHHEVATGCVEWNYRIPHCCSPPKCQFMVAWSDGKEDTIDFHLVAAVTPNTSVWAAIGFSENRLMSDSDVVACWLPQTSHPQFREGWIETDSRELIIEEMDAVHPVSVSVVDNQLHCRFSRRKVLTNTTMMSGKDLTQQLHILAATGPLLGSDDTLKMAAHARKIASACQCNLTDCTRTCVCMSAIEYLLLKLHGVVMTVGFVFFLPVGALVSRYYRVVFVSSWFKAHVTMMVFTMLCGGAGLGLILAHTGGTFSIGYHQIVGAVCLSLGFLQPLVAIIRPVPGPTTRRKVFNIFHRVMALLIIVLGVTALFLGVYLFRSTQVLWMLAALGVSVITNMAFMLLLELLTRTQKFSSTLLPPVGYHKVTKHDELSESEEEVYVRDIPSKPKSTLKPEPYRFEQALLLLFVIQSFCFAVIIAGLIYFYDSLNM